MGKIVNLLIILVIIAIIFCLYFIITIKVFHKPEQYKEAGKRFFERRVHYHDEEAYSHSSCAPDDFPGAAADRTGRNGRWRFSDR